MRVSPEAVKIPDNLMRSRIDDRKYEELKRSITRFGLIQPVAVRKVGKVYELIAGYRRIKAFIDLKIEWIPVTILKGDDLRVEGMKMAENNDREDVNPIDEGEYLAGLIVKHGMNQKELAAVMHKSEAYISQRLGTAKWMSKIRELVRDGDLNFSVARELQTIKDIEKREYYLNHTVLRGAAPSLVREWARQANDETAREEVEQAGGGAELIRTSDTVAMVHCDHCAEDMPAMGSSGTLGCQYCKATIDDPGYHDYMRRAKAEWIRAGEEMEAAARGEVSEKGLQKTAMDSEEVAHPGEEG